MLRQAASTEDGSRHPHPPEPHSLHATNRAPLVPVVLQPLSRSVELPPQYRPRKPRKQVNVACQSCRKRRSKCTGTAPCSRCVAEGHECIFDGRKDAQERNRELRNSEKALSRVYCAIRRLDAGEPRSAAASFAQIRKLAQSKSDFQAFARGLFDLEDKNGEEDGETEIRQSPNGLEQLDGYSTQESTHNNSSNTQSNETSSSPQFSNEGRITPRGSHASNPSLPNSRNNSIAHRKHSSGQSMSDFGNLPFSSAIKANGYPIAIQKQQIANLNIAEHSHLPLHSFENEILGRAYLSFRDASLQMISDGIPATQVLGSPNLINLDLYFRDRRPGDPHTVSTFVCELMKALANPDVIAKLASIVLMVPMIRWTLFPTAENYARIPELMRPLPSQRFIPHSPAIDLPPHPATREACMRQYNDKWLTPENQILAAPIVDWPYGIEDTVYHDPIAGCMTFTKLFVDHITQPSSWAFLKKVADVFPNIEDYGARIVDLDDSVRDRFSSEALRRCVC